MRFGKGEGSGHNASDRSLRELEERARTPQGAPLLAFRSCIGAHQYRRLHAWVLEWVPAGAEVLDWGAGNGHFSHFLQRAGYRATGFSLGSGDFVPHLPDPAAYRFVAGSPEEPTRLPFPDAHFDAVCSVGVLEHVRETGGDELASLLELRRVLRPGGCLLCFHLPSRRSWIEGAARYLPGAHRHARRFDAVQVSQLVAKAQLELLHLCAYGLLPRNRAAALPAGLRHSLWLARLWDRADRGLERLAGRWAQNWCFVARRS